MSVIYNTPPQLHARAQKLHEDVDCMRKESLILLEL